MLKNLLLKKVPVWVILVAIIATIYFVKFVDAKPDKGLIPIQINGVERILIKQATLPQSPEFIDYNKFINRFLYLSMLEYRNFFRITYGEITPEEEEAFKGILNKLEK